MWRSCVGVLACSGYSFCGHSDGFGSPGRRLLVPVLCGSQPLWMLSSVLFFRLPLLQGRCASGLRCLVPTWAALFVQSQHPFVVGSPSAVNICPTPALAGQVRWSRSFVPSCYSCGLSSLGVSAAAFCPLGLLSHPILPLFLAWVSSFGVCSGLGLRAAVHFLDPPFFVGGGCSVSLVLVVLAWLLQLFCGPGSLVFLDFFLGFLSSRLPVFAGSSGWLPYSPWLYALRCLATGIVNLFFCQGPVSLP